MTRDESRRYRRPRRESPRSRHTVGATLTKLLRPSAGRYLRSQHSSRHASDETGDIPPTSQNYIPSPDPQLRNRGEGRGGERRGLIIPTPVEGATAVPQPTSVHAIGRPRHDKAHHTVRTSRHPSRAWKRSSGSSRSRYARLRSQLHQEGGLGHLSFLAGVHKRFHAEPWPRAETSAGVLGRRCYDGGHQ